MTNRLAHENSPYLIQHAENPVDWYPWGPEALQKARLEDKPIFLSIGYAACHWCHVMAHESFEDPQTAAILNEHFINIKVDREERPDLDAIYMHAVTAITGSGGWPMSVFLTPDGQPFYGGTYFPPARRYNLPSFQEILHTIRRLWSEDRPKVLQSSAEITRYLSASLSSAALPTVAGQHAGPDGTPVLDPAVCDQAALRLAQSYDWADGGWGRAPKFPQPMALEFLLARASRGDRMALDVSLHALQSMDRGGMYDVIGGGFARYSVDNHWLTPHFEKMLYDNAQLARVYLAAFQLTGDERYRRTCTATLDFIARELRSDASLGGFFSSLDADSEGHEGKFYLWTEPELRSELQQAQKSYEDAQLQVHAAGHPSVTAPPADALSEDEAPPLDWAEFFIYAYGVTPNGNFEGQTILQRQVDDAELVARYHLEPSRVNPILDRMHAHLYRVRARRVWPGLDDKVLTGWNALALTAFAEAARYLDRRDYRDIAVANAEFLLANLVVDGKLQRAWRAGRARHAAVLEDVAGLILGLIALYQTDPDPRWFAAARRFTHTLLEHFADSAGGFFDTSDDQETLIVRPKDLQDNALPSGNALAALALLQMSVLDGETDWRLAAERMLAPLYELVVKYPTAFSKWLCAFDFATQTIQEIAVLHPPDGPLPQPLIEPLWKGYQPHRLTAISPHPPHPDAPRLLLDRPLIDDRPTAYVCRNFTCLQPVTEPEELRRQLRL